MTLNSNQPDALDEEDLLFYSTTIGRRLVHVRVKHIPTDFVCDAFGKNYLNARVIALAGLMSMVMADKKSKEGDNVEEPTSNSPKKTIGVPSRQTTYAVAIENRAQKIMKELGAYNYDECLTQIEHVRQFCNALEREIEAEKKANPQHAK